MGILHSSFFWILLAGLPYGAIHSAFASQRMKRWFATKLGVESARTYRLIFVLQSFIFTFIYLALVFLLPDRTLYIIPAPWIYFSFALELGIAFCDFLSLQQTGILAFLGLDFLFTRANASANPTLHTRGFYAFVRHPLYFFGIFFIWLLPAMTWNLLAWNIGVTVYMIIGSRFEEHKLIHDFGQPYLDYRSRVPAFWPRLTLKH